MAKRKNLELKEDLYTESLTQMNINRTRMGEREFRDALTRASGSVTGVKTQSAQWNRWKV